MHKVLKVALVLLVCVVVVGGAYCAHKYSAAMEIDPAVGIDEAMYVPIGDTWQWVQIRGRDRKNPVVLWLNGGPGFSTIPQTYFFVELEKEFTVVMWDQRGEGRSYARTGPAIGPTMSIERMAADGVEVAEFLRTHLGISKLAILSHSWGSILGIHMAQHRPDLFSAYIATGQVINLKEALKRTYPVILQKARNAGNERAVEELQANGSPPYEDPERYLIPIRWANEFDATTPSGGRRLSAGGLWALFRSVSSGGGSLREGAAFSQKQMLRPMLEEDIAAVGTAFAMPVVFIQGSEDLLCPSSLVQDYVSQVVAPEKRLINLQGAGHLAILRDREVFQRALHEVRPLFAQATN